MKSLTDTFQLRNKVEIPCIGYGTWKTPDGETASVSVKTAIELGYRHIDTAAAYGNETSVGEGIRESGISREQLFVTSKVWNTERGYEKTLHAFEKTCQDLGTDYLDLYLIHWPASVNQFENWEEINISTWKAMMELYKEGRIRAIGVSNFMPHHLKALMETEIIPMVDQIEFHPGWIQNETVKYCKENMIQVEAWSPLGNGRVLNHPNLQQIAQKYGIWDSVFGDDPVNVQLTSFSSGPEVNEAITAGDIDIVINEGDQPFLSGIANGVDLTILSTELRQEKTLILVADSNSEIQSAADLKGKNIAVPLGTYVHKSLIGVLQDNGISVDDVQLTNISAAGDAVAAIENGNVDVYIGTIFSLYSEIQDGKIKQIADLTGNGAYAYLIVAVYYIQPLEYYEQTYSVQQAQHKQKFPLYVHLDKYAE